MRDNMAYGKHDKLEWKQSFSMQDDRKLQQKKYCNIVSIGEQTRLTLAQERTPTEILTSDPTIVFQTSKQALDQLQKKQNKGRLNYLTKAQEQG